MTDAKIFISYSRKDSDVVLPFRDEIEQHIAPGVCWIDRRIKGYQRFDDEIIKAILSTDVFVFMHSANAQKSEWTRKEIDFASKNKKKIYVVLIDDAPFEHWFEFEYGKLQRTKLDDSSDKAKLLDDIKSLISDESVSETNASPVLVDAEDETNASPVLADAEDETIAQPVFVDAEDETVTVNGISFKMVAVKGGTFTMRSSAYKVTLSSYRIGETEVTQQLWQSVMGSNPSKIKGPQNPVERVSWNDCQKFISKLNGLTGKCFRLPTEAEWVYAAKGGNKSQGYMYSGSDSVEETSWYIANSRLRTHDVKTKSPNELGIYDMSGNVWEWCSDWDDDNCPSTPATDPTGPPEGSYRVFRGGGWLSFAWLCDVTYRRSLEPSVRSSCLGLRLAMDI